MIDHTKIKSLIFKFIYISLVAFIIDILRWNENEIWRGCGPPHAVEVLNILTFMFLKNVFSAELSQLLPIISRITSDSFDPNIHV